MPRNNSKILTDVMVKRLPKAPPGKRIQHFDKLAPGLAIVVTHTGTRSWVVYYYLDGKHRKEMVGHYPGVSIANARTLAGEKKMLAKMGIDPVVAARYEAATEIERQRVAQRNTFRSIAQMWLTENGAKFRSAGNTERKLRVDVFPTLGDRPIQEITRNEVKELVWSRVARHPVAANATLDAVRTIFSYALDEGYIETSPCQRIKYPGLAPPRQRILADDELRAIWWACEGMGPYCRIIRLLILTGCRRDEIRALPTSEVDLDERIIVIPASRYKTKIEHVVPLSDLAIEQLGDPMSEPFVFMQQRYVRRGTPRPFNGTNRYKKMVNEISGVDDWRPHDFRRTCETNLAKMRFPTEIRDRVMGHKAGRIQQTYNRYDYLDDKRRALDTWADRVREIISGTEAATNVHKLAG